jgi:acetoin utilization protein AcuC
VIRDFYLEDGVFDYSFGPSHPLKPERLKRTMLLLEHYTGATRSPSEREVGSNLVRVHSDEFIEAVATIDRAVLEGRDGDDEILELRSDHGFWGDNPPFKGMDRAARAYVRSTAAAARAVAAGHGIAFGIGGGLHHALRAKASGFCIYNDPAIACSILRESFDRVAYVDIDVHHGDGVQWIWYDDPSVLTCSIHESGRTLWPGTGGIEETGTEYSSLNVPMEAGTTADVWLDAFERTILPALETWSPQAIVLQMGTDTHYLDPLAHINSNQQAWLAAIKRVAELRVPLVALGGGGYDLTTVPRMWVSAILSLAGIEYDDEIPADLAERLGAKTFSDRTYPFGSDGGRTHADHVIEHIQRVHLPQLKSNP